MVLPLVLQGLLQVEAAGQVALGQVVAQLRHAEQARLDVHALPVAGHAHTHTHSPLVYAVDTLGATVRLVYPGGK